MVRSNLFLRNIQVFVISRQEILLDVYSFGIIMYLIATGKPPFRDREFDRDLLYDIMGGLRPSMPDSAPKEYKKLAKWCCDADPDKHPDARTLCGDIDELVIEVKYDNSVSNA